MPSGMATSARGRGTCECGAGGCARLFVPARSGRRARVLGGDPNESLRWMRYSGARIGGPYMVAAPGSRTRLPLILKVLVIAALAFLAAVAGVAPFVVPPAGVSAGVGLASFQIMLAAAAGFLALIL